MGRGVRVAVGGDTVGSGEPVGARVYVAVGPGVSVGRPDGVSVRVASGIVGLADGGLVGCARPVAVAITVPSRPERATSVAAAAWALAVAAGGCRPAVWEAKACMVPMASLFWSTLERSGRLQASVTRSGKPIRMSHR